MSKFAEWPPPEVYHMLGPRLKFEHSLRHLTDPSLGHKVHDFEGIPIFDRYRTAVFF